VEFLVKAKDLLVEDNSFEVLDYFPAKEFFAVPPSTFFQVVWFPTHIK